MEGKPNAPFESDASTAGPPPNNYHVEPITDLRPTVIFDYAWQWLQDRDEVYQNRRKNRSSPWSSSEVINTHRFCSARPGDDASRN